MTREDAGVTQRLAAGGMTSPGRGSALAAGQEGFFISPLRREHHKILHPKDVAVPRGPYAHNEEGQGGGDFSFHPA